MERTAPLALLLALASCGGGTSEAPIHPRASRAAPARLARRPSGTSQSREERANAPAITSEPPATITDACLDAAGAEPFVRYRPPCDLVESTVFFRRPGNVVVVPSEAGLGTCHDDEVWFPAPADGCTPARPVAIGADAIARTLEEGRAVPARWAAAVQVGVVELPLAWAPRIAEEVARVTGRRAVLALRLRGAFDPAELAPIADRLVGLFVERACDDDDCDDAIDLARLPVMPSLRVFELVYRGSARGVASLSRHPRLEGLRLACDLDPGEVAALGRLRGLTSLSVAGDRPEMLRALSGLEHASVTGSAVNVRALAGHRRLTSLVLLEPIEDAALAELSRAPSLRHLSTGVQGLTDAGARSLARARQLETIFVRARNPVEDEAVQALESLPSLAHHPRARVVLDVDESVPYALSGPWRDLACRIEGATCEPTDPNPR